VYANGDFEATVDAYRTAIDSRIVRSKGIGCTGVAACDAAGVATAALFINGVDTETQGIDVRARWQTTLADGLLWLSANAHSNETEITGRRMPAGAPANLTFDDYYGGWAAQLLVEGQPKQQANVTAEWERGGLGLLGRVNYYGETTQNPVDTGTVTIEAASTVDLEARSAVGRVDWSLGINNVLDELPTELAKTHLSNILWGVRYPVDTPFGIAGRFAYLRVSFEFGE
ncbi:MAG: TonB-dependent receptor, partial [Gammaproteobacteria bacterium]|nr:TonB-dependent receptor [Gammaproteobacteria bacterium]